MSKMSELAMLLDDQAMELGFESHEDAIERGGYEVDYVNAKLFKPDEQERAHMSWLAEKQKLLEELCLTYQSMIDTNSTEWASVVARAIKFIERGDM